MDCHLNYNCFTMISVLSLYCGLVSEAVCFKGLMRIRNDFFPLPLMFFGVFLASAKILWNLLWCMFQTLINKPRKKMYCSSFYVIYFSDSTQEQFPPLIIFIASWLINSWLWQRGYCLTTHKSLIHHIIYAFTERALSGEEHWRCDVLLSFFLIHFSKYYTDFLSEVIIFLISWENVIQG